jgi:thiol:disulfide interchange protein DsbC
MLFAESPLKKCPPMEKVSANIEKILNKGVDLVNISPTPFDGICEVHVRMKNQDRIFYTDSESKFFFLGQLVDTQSGENLTRESMAKFMRMSPEEMAELSTLVAFSIGKAGQTIYYVTDPQCLYCKQGGKILKKMADAGEITVHFLMFPLDFHKGAKEQCVSVICDKKGVEEFESGYKSENQCAEGTSKVEKTIDLLRKKGISGTPAYIFPNRFFHVGALDENSLRQQLGLPPVKIEAPEEDGSDKTDESIEAPEKTESPKKPEAPESPEPQKAAEPAADKAN